MRRGCCCDGDVGLQPPPPQPGEEAGALWLVSHTPSVLPQLKLTAETAHLFFIRLYLVNFSRWKMLRHNPAVQVLLLHRRNHFNLIMIIITVLNNNGVKQLSTVFFFNCCIKPQQTTTILKTDVTLFDLLLLFIL